MMKSRFWFTAIGFFSPLFALAQTAKPSQTSQGVEMPTYYFDANWNRIVDADTATFVRKSFLKSKTYYVTDSYKRGSITYMTGQFTSIVDLKKSFKESTSATDKIEFFYKDGKKKAEYNFEMGYLQGDVKIFYQNGKPKRHAKYDKGRLVKDHKLYDDKGNLAIVLDYEEKQSVVYTAEHPKGDTVALEPEFAAMYEGDTTANAKASSRKMQKIQAEKALPNWLKEQTKKYPMTGKAVCFMYIDEKGKIVSYQVLDADTEELEKAALEILAKMPKWTPARKVGKNVGDLQTLVIDF